MRIVARILYAGLVVAVLTSACGVPSTETVSELPPATVADTTVPRSSTTTTQPPKERVSVYFVGNSLTHGSLGELARGYRAWYVLATQADIVPDPFGWHIRCGSSLVSITRNPRDTCVEPSSDAGLYRDALRAEPWDFVSFQPYPGSGSTLATDLQAITRASAGIPPDTTVVVFTGWPPAEGFAASWNAQIEVTDDTPTMHARAYFDELVSRLDDELSNDVLLVPAAEVFYRLDRKLGAGAVPGIDSIEDLFGDEIHMDSIGNWVAGVTIASVLFDTDPATFGKPTEPWYGPGEAFRDGFVSLVRETVAEVVG